MTYLLTLVLLVLFLGYPQTPAAEKPDGAQVFQASCYSCHHAGSGYAAPTMDQFHQMTRSSIVRALEFGRMKEQGAHLTLDERAALAEFLGRPDDAPPALPAGSCAAKTFSTAGDPSWNGWGADVSNSRFQPAGKAGLMPGDVPRLKLKWAFGYAGASATYGQPAVAGGRVFVGSEDGTVYSLDARTGCTFWTYKAEATVKTAIALDSAGHTAFFGDTNGNVYAILSENGRPLWKIRMDSHPAARITGSPVFFGVRLYVPVSSGDEGAAMDPHYACCTFRGSVVAIDPQSGNTIWKAYTIPESAKLTGKRNSAGTPQWGPAGAAVWSSPTLDLKARAIYVATGNAYSEIDSRYSDAVIAFDMNSGKLLWSKQLTRASTSASGKLASR